MNILLLKNNHPAVIDEEQFNHVQQLMKSKSKIKSKSQKHLFINLVFCGGCGRGLWYRKTKNDGSYNCGGKYYDGKLDEDFYNRMLNQSTDNLNELEVQLNEALEVKEEIRTFNSIEEVQHELLNFLTDKDTAAGETLFRFIERIVVNDEQKVEVSYRFSV